MRMDGQAQVGSVAAHFDGKGHFGDEIAGVRPDDAAADDSARGRVEQQLGHAIVTAER